MKVRLGLVKADTTGANCLDKMGSNKLLNEMFCTKCLMYKIGDIHRYWTCN